MNINKDTAKLAAKKGFDNWTDFDVQVVSDAIPEGITEIEFLLDNFNKVKYLEKKDGKVLAHDNYGNSYSLSNLNDDKIMYVCEELDLPMTCTQTSLQTWLRKQNIVVYPVIFSHVRKEKDKFFYSWVIKYKMNTNEIIYVSEEEYLSWEDCLENGLQEALKKNIMILS